MPRGLESQKEKKKEKKTQRPTSNQIYTFLAAFLGFIFAEPSSKVQQISSYLSK